MTTPTASATELTRLKGIGPKMAERFARLGIDSVEQLLFHLPLRYEDRTRVTPLGALRAGMHTVIEGEVQLSEIKFARRRMLLVRLSDRTGFITLRFFHFNARQQENLARGKRVRAYGEVRRGGGGLEMVHPEFSVIETDAAPAAETGLTPVYPTTEGLHQLTLRNVMQQALALLRADRLPLPELLPAGLLAADALPDLKQALLFVHQPPIETDLDELLEARHPVMQRLIIEDLLAHVLSLRQLRQRSRTHQARVLSTHGELVEQFRAALPFELTAAQQRVLAEIETDITQPVPMQRLVQGDVGSGKTVVAALAALAAVNAGYQAAIMAPTEILAEQHYHNFAAWLAPLGIEVAWLSGRAKQSERRVAGEALASGQAAVAVGTHALFQEEVQFSDLALVIIDEQHRFGVHQRLALREKGRRDDALPHQLIMTATPIPRTLSMAVYADLDCSVIDELPPGRQPVETVVLPDGRRDEVVARVHRACQQGNQVYWVCTLIEESEALQCQAAEETAQLLQAALPDVRVGLVHGRLKPQAKEAIMARFKGGELDLLVATTVIEVGVDVPNAGLMIIENAERLGLAQLHQLRGRVGRGGQASVCVLMYYGTLSANARERLAVMRRSNDGFEIARKDMELRGPGEVLGTRQTGLLQLKIADLQRDEALMPKVVSLSDQLLKQHPEAVQPLIQRWVGQAVRYGNV
ncbi:ATP-dependent DNA helicase RecG [Thiohalophilus sp.]|uniref:ATP-dependent DNA helicase RecG n=1 Tax=Thiohalophilus sp. TaxID=3028392 RepID=UPI002ACECC5E|nr:ATP-dependent DNA helicase RecG [Thiohalophilus sp.]MDZ7661732.1 ATP-dependent DNA helicase RecG [Thiohalophilus sp.]